MDQGVRTHRREEAGRGFPLLRGCPSTVVLRRLAVLDGLGEAERIAYADQLSVLAAAEAVPLSLAARTSLLARLPLVARVEAELPGREDLRFQTVKSLARLAGEPGGIERLVRAQGLEGAAAGPPVPHVPSFAEAVPVAPGRLRKAVLGALQARFGGTVRRVSRDQEQLVADVPHGRMVLDLRLAGRSWGVMGPQLEYSFSAEVDGRRMAPTSYEAMWLLPAQWDLLTPGNVEAAAVHLARVVEARLALG